MEAQTFEKLKKCGHDVLWIEMLTGRNCIYGSPSALTLILLFILWSSIYCVSTVLNTELGTRNTKKTNTIQWSLVNNEMKLYLSGYYDSTANCERNITWNKHWWREVFMNPNYTEIRIFGYTRKEKMDFRMETVQTDFESWVRLVQMARE